jgi:hypothetical protein
MIFLICLKRARRKPTSSSLIEQRGHGRGSLGRSAAAEIPAATPLTSRTGCITTRFIAPPTSSICSMVASTEWSICFSLCRARSPDLLAGWSYRFVCKELFIGCGRSDNYCGRSGNNHDNDSRPVSHPDQLLLCPTAGLNGRSPQSPEESEQLDPVLGPR